MPRTVLQSARTIVVKVGSSLLASVRGGIDRAYMAGLVAQIAGVRAGGRRVVLVSSGAVAAGTAELGHVQRPEDLAEVQAAAAVGQGALMQLYREAFGWYDVTVAQVLLTRDGLHSRQRYLHARNTLRVLLERGALPIVNENDTVAVEELKIRIGDNDALAASTAQLVQADALVLLTDVPGLYDKPPDRAGAELIHHVAELTPDVLDMGGGSTSGVGQGGMSSKLQAALAANLGAIPVVVAPGGAERVLERVLAGEEVGPFFAPREKRASLRQQWIAFGRRPDGRVVIDAGARDALVLGKRSLLAIGVREVHGDFAAADTVAIVDAQGVELARGLCAVSAAELRAIAGHSSAEFERILGYRCSETVVHRDDLLILHTEPNGTAPA